MLLVDTGVFLAAADRREAEHSACVEVIRAHRADLTVVAPVIAEAAWLIERRLGAAAEAAFLRLVTTGAVRLIDLTADDYERSVALIEQYADLGLGFVDASIVAVAERLGIASLATLNHRDFRAVRPNHVEAFDLLP